MESGSVKPLRILYIEDDELVRDLVCEILSSAGRAIVAVATGEEALTALAESPFDIVITDVSLPTISGLDVARHLRQLCPSMPVILASGYELDLSDAQLGPMVRAITKPFDSPQMNALIAELCCGR
jgi:CheY-like chemotaxis protein